MVTTHRFLAPRLWPGKEKIANARKGSMSWGTNARNTGTALLCFFVGFGCSDADTGGTGTGIPGGVSVVTSLDTATAPMGAVVTVTCAVLDGSGGALDTETTFAYSPEVGLVRGEGSTVIGEATGTYDIRCSAPALGLSDAVGASLTIIDAVPAKVTTTLDPEVVQIDEQSTVTCRVSDASGTDIAMATHVTAAPEVVVTGNKVSSNTIGIHQVTCHATGFANLEEESATLAVLSGDPSSVKLMVKPDKEIYKIGNILTFSWVGVDADGNEIEGLPGTLSLPIEGFAAVDVAANKYKATKDGVYPVSVKLHAPFDTLTDERMITVDGTPPKIVITFPERGVQIVGNGEPLTVTGVITEDVGSIASFIVNDQTVGIGDDGAFSVDITPKWGVNLIEAYAKDSNGNQGKLTPTYQYSEGFTSFVATDAEGVKVPDGMEIMLGESFLDDGVHDHQDIDDMATLLEVILTNLDLEQVINDALSGVAGSQPLGQLLGFEATLSYSLLVVPPTDVGPTKVSLDSIDGGIKFSIEIGDQTQPGLDLTMQLQGLITVEEPLFNTQIGEASLNLNTGATIQRMKISGTLMMDKEEGGDLSADLNDLKMELEGVELDPIEDVYIEMTLTPPFVAPISANFNLSDLIDINALTDSVLDPAIATLSDVILQFLEPTLDQFMGTIIEIVLDSFGIQETLAVPNFLNPSAPEIEIQYYTEMSSVHFDEPGAEMGLGIGFYTPKGIEKDALGAIQRFSCLADYPSEFTYDWEHELALALRTDALNGLFFSIWWSGLLNGPLDLAGVVGGGLPIPVDTMSLSMEFLAPPVLNDCSKASGIEIQVGDMFLDLAGSLLGFDLDADAYADLTLLATFKTKEDGFYIEVGDLKDFDVEVVSVGPNADYEEMKSLLEDELPTILGAFLVGQEFGPIELPVIDLGDSIPGVPEGSVLEFQDLQIGKSSGYVLIEGELD
jgi:hypothetical protein